MLNQLNFKTSVITALLLMSVSACDVVKLDANGKPILPVSAEAAASMENMTPKDIAEKLWSKVVDEANKSALPWDKFKAETANLSSEKGKSYFVRMNGAISQLNLTTKERTLQLNVGSEVVTLQLGPITRGNSIRDAASFIQFDQFKNQVQFAKLSKEFNKKSLSIVKMPDDSWKGKNIDVVAALTVTNNTISDVIPIEISER